jgi:hypothetical protein
LLGAPAAEALPTDPGVVYRYRVHAVVINAPAPRDRDALAAYHVQVGTVADDILRFRTAAGSPVARQRLPPHRSPPS